MVSHFRKMQIYENISEIVYSVNLIEMEYSCVFDTVFDRACIICHVHGLVPDSLSIALVIYRFFVNDASFTSSPVNSFGPSQN